MNKIIFLIVLLFLVLSCSKEQNNLNFEKKLQQNFEKSLGEIGIKIRDSAHIKNKTFYFSMIQDSGYYVDNNTNHLVRSYLLFKHYNEMKELDSVNIHVESKGLIDANTYYYPRHGIDKIHAKLSKNPLFVDLLPYLVNNTDANDIIYMDDTINGLSKYVSKEKYNFEGSGFWEFIYEYTLHSCDSKSDMHKNMNEVHHASTYPKFPTRPDIFEYVIKKSEEYCEKR